MGTDLQLNLRFGLLVSMKIFKWPKKVPTSTYREAHTVQSNQGSNVQEPGPSTPVIQNWMSIHLTTVQYTLPPGITGSERPCEVAVVRVPRCASLLRRCVLISDESTFQA